MVAATARAEWGELGHFSIPTGTAEKQVNFTSSFSTLAFATDSADSSYYIGDEPKPGEFRIQRFEAGVQDAAISFVPPESKKAQEGIGETGVGLQLTVDPAHDRVYALVLYRRRSLSEKEEKEEEKEFEQWEKEKKEEEKGEKPIGSRLIQQYHEYFPLDDEEVAAGELYAFELVNGSLVSAKESEGKPVPIIGETAFADQGEQPKEALLNPRGMAVDPKTGDLTILGAEDEEPNAKVEKEESEKQCRAAAQFITIALKTGKVSGGKLGKRFVDKEDLLRHEEHGCSPEEITDVPLSPVVTPGGNLLFYSGAESEGQIWEAPTPGSEGGEGEVETKPVLLFNEHQIGGPLNLEPPESGGPAVMSFAPEGADEGRIYLSVQGLAHEPIPLALHYKESSDKSSEVSEIGWTAGGAGEACGIPSPDNVTAVMGAGDERVLVLDAYLEEAAPHSARVETFAFGPGDANGCPKATLGPPQMIVGLDQDAHSAQTGEAVTLASELGGAGAKRVKWEFKYKSTDGQVGTETVEQTTAQLLSLHGEYELLPLKYEFKHAGTYEISEVVEGDDLADETITASEVLHVTVTALTPILKPVPPKAVRANEEEATLTATVEDPNASEKPTLHLKKVKWEFGDGSSAVEETPGDLPNPTELHVKHTFISRCGSKGKCKITLTVEDSAAEGTPAVTSFEIAVNESHAEEVQHQKEAEKVAEEAAAAKLAAEKQAAQEAVAKKAAEEAAAKKAAEEATAKKAAEEAAAKKAAEEAAKKKAEEEAKAKAKLTPLQKALKQCKREPKSKRAKCEAAAKKKYRKHKKKGKKKK